MIGNGYTFHTILHRLVYQLGTEGYFPLSK
jgi:hypothetical protein